MKTISKLFLIVFVSLAASYLFAQSADINTFVKKVEAAGRLMATVQAADGSYVTIIDHTLVMKIKVSGQKQWERRLNFDVDGGASMFAITQTTDGGFVLAGHAGCDNDFDCRFDPQSVAILVKLRPNGTVAWKKGLAVNGSGFAIFSSVIATTDGGVIATGGHSGDLMHLLIVRVTATGDVIWKKSFKTPVDFFGGIPTISPAATPDNGFIVAYPFYNIPNGFDVMKITNSGNVVWKKRLIAFDLHSVGVTTDGGVILVGGAGKELKVVVLNANGTLNWNAGYSLKVHPPIQFVSSPAQTPDGGYVITGRTLYGAKDSGFIVKIDSSRKVAFQKTFGNGQGWGDSVFTTPDGGFFLFGQLATNRESDVVVLKTNSEGIVPGCDFFGSSGEVTSAHFGQFKIGGANITESADLSLEAFDFGLTSVITNHPITTICQ